MGRWKLGGPRAPSYYVLGGPLSPEALLSQLWALCILRNTGVVPGKIQREEEDSLALRCMCQNVMATREYQVALGAPPGCSFSPIFMSLVAKAGSLSQELVGLTGAVFLEDQ